jgi:acyl carrier protein
MSSLDFFALFKQAAGEVSGQTFDGLDKATTLSDIGLDSVAILELVGYLEEKLDVRLSDEELAAVNTLGDLDDLLRRSTAAKDQP